MIYNIEFSIPDICSARHGTAETKALIAAWDPEETVKLKQARNLGGWQPQKEKKGRAKPVVQAELTPQHASMDHLRHARHVRHVGKHPKLRRI
jgi:hypothetical protein